MLLHGYDPSDGSFTGTSKFSNPVMEKTQKGNATIVDDFTFAEDPDLYTTDGATFTLIEGWEDIKTERNLPFADVPSAKAAKLAELAEIRWNAEESGTTFGGNPLATDRTTQAKLTAGYAKAVNDPDFVIASWKFAAGVFGSLDATTIIAAANAVEAHIQACFTNEKTLSGDIIAAADFAELEAVDLTVGWQRMNAKT
jgi:hypothetical protein